MTLCVPGDVQVGASSWAALHVAVPASRHMPLEHLLVYGLGHHACAALHAALAAQVSHTSGRARGGAGGAQLQVQAGRPRRCRGGSAARASGCPLLVCCIRRVHQLMTHMAWSQQHPVYPICCRRHQVQIWKVLGPWQTSALAAGLLADVAAVKKPRREG